MAIPAGLEPATCGLEIRCSIQLSYGTAFGAGLGARLAGSRPGYWDLTDHSDLGKPQTACGSGFPPALLIVSGLVHLLGPLVCPGIKAAVFKIIGIGFFLALALFRLFNPVGQPVALGIGDGLLLGGKTQADLRFHIAGTGPAHEGFHFAGNFGIIFQHPVLCLGTAGLHGCLGGFVNTGHHDLLQFP